MAEKEQVGGSGMQRAGQAGTGVTAGGLADKALAIVSAMRERLMAMPAGKRTWLIASGVFLIAMCTGMIWFAGRPDWRVLFSGLDGKDMQQVSQELAAAGIQYEPTADGAGVQVPADVLDKARMEVASKGMPQSGRLGFELFDKPNWVGSEFDERVNYQRALEGELERTIGTLGVVKSARVHLVLPQPSLFSAEEKTAKASVVLKLNRASVDPEQADAIRSLVAGSVENLSADQVTLVDADGRVNFKQRSSNASEADAEEALEAKLVAMLEPLAGRDNVRATVNVSYDDGSEERTDEVYDPSQEATLTMQKSDQVSADAVQLREFRELRATLPPVHRKERLQDRRRQRHRGRHHCCRSRRCRFIRSRTLGKAKACMKRMELTESQNIWCIPKRGLDGCGACRPQWW